MITPLRIPVLFLSVFWVAQIAQADPANFTLQSATDSKTFKLSDAKGKYVALHFLLKTECPYCLRYTHDYLQNASADSNVVHIFLKPDTQEEIRSWATKLKGESATIYRDPDAQLAKAFKIPNGYRFHGQVVHFPALVLLDPEGREIFRYVGKNNSDRFTREKLSEKLVELTTTKEAKRSTK